jgi:hypothetical protein
MVWPGTTLVVSDVVVALSRLLPPVGLACVIVPMILLFAALPLPLPILVGLVAISLGKGALSAD